MRLSSSGTTFYKVIFPAFWLTGFGVGAIAVALGVGEPSLPVEIRVMFPVGWLFGLVLCAWLCFPLKHVSLVSGAVVVEGLRRKTTIPLSDIAAVSGSFATNPEIITVSLKQPCAFGTRIRFMPSVRFWRFSPHPTLTMLSEMLVSRRQ
jgi:hypothetical protein